jgi:hypothetical protein
VRYTKKFDDEIYLFEEVRTGRKELAFETMYKRKIKGSEQLNAPPLLTPKNDSLLSKPTLQAG